MAEYYIEDDQVYLLISPGYGAGWSTWSEPELAYDKRVVEKYLQLQKSKLDKSQQADEMENYLRSIGYESAYVGGYSQLTVEKVPLGTPYHISEYDGFEELTTGNKMPVAGEKGRL